MNRHRAYWSVMGSGENMELSHEQKLKITHREQLMHMINSYNHDGFHEIVKLLREIKEG